MEITQAKDLNTITLEDLIGSLKAHETLLQNDTPSRKGKMVALKASQNEQEDVFTPSEEIKESNEEESIQGEAEDELALITKKIQRMMRRRDQIKKYFPNKKDNTKGEIDKSQVTCFGCNKLGHYKNECPLNRKGQKKSPYSKSMFTWDDLEEPKEEHTEANMVLMANSENEEGSSQDARTKPLYLDNGCSRHMTGDKQCFISFIKREGGLVTFGNNDKGKIKG